MTVITRSWLAFAAFGAGVVHLALVISSPLPIAVLLLALGLAELSWGVLILVKDRMLVPRVAQAAAISPLILWALLTVVATLLNTASIASSLRFVPMGIAAIFDLFIAAVLSVYLRRRADRKADDADSTPAAPSSAVRYLAAIIVAGVLVGGLTTPALAATQAGTVALEHGGTMSGMMMMDMPGSGH